MRATAPRLRLAIDDGGRIPAGPALDREIDRRIFRREGADDGARYSSEYEAGLRLEYQLSRAGWRMELGNAGPYWVTLERGGQAITASGETVELALCRAALKAVDAA